MLFLHTLMLLGVLGIAIPVIIHLLNRRQAKIVEWGAMRFLLDSLVSRRRRVLLEEILLLAARCLIVALVALALARPFIPAGSTVPWMVVLPAALLAVVLFGVSFALWRYPVWRRRVVGAAVLLAAVAAAAVFLERWLNLRRLGRGGGRDVALVIDGSSSMSMSSDGRSNFDRALQEARQCIAAAPRGHAFSLVIAGSVPGIVVPAPVADRKHLLQALEAAVPVQGTMQTLDTLAVAAATLAQGYNVNKQIVLIGDGQSIGWKADNPDLWEHLRQAFGRLPQPPQVVFRRLNLPEAIRNASLASVAFSRQVIGTDREVRVDVTVANTGTEAVTPQEVRLQIGDRVQTDRSLGQLAPGASATASFRHRFSRPGTEIVRARVSAGDELPGDDEAVRVVQVVDRLRVLVVDASPASRFLDRPGAFAALALMPDVRGLAAPAAGAAADKPNADFLVTPELAAVAELSGRPSLGDVGAIVLADVPQLPAPLADRLADFVAQGGGLLVAAGSHCQPAFYNAWRGDAGAVLPLPLGRLTVTPDTNRPALDPRSFEHPALKPLAGASDLESAQFERYWTAASESEPATRVGARLANGVPFLAERPYGRGCVAQINAPLDVSAGTLVARQGFVPLLHELVYHLAQPVVVDLNIRPSRGATIPLGANRAAGGGDGRHGLRGEYFAQRERHVGGVVRIDPTVDFSWPGSPIEGVPANGYWVQWTGSLAVPADGTYRFGSAAGGLSVWLDGRRVVTPDDPQGMIALRKGRRHDFRADFRDRRGGGAARACVTISGPGLAPQTLPTAFLSPLRGTDEASSAGVETLIQGPEKQPFPGRFATGTEGVSLRVDRNLAPGLYRARVPEAVAHKVARLRDAEGLLPFSVIVDGDESRVQPLSPAELAFVGRYVRLLVAGTTDDLLRAVRGEAFGRELWQILALAALVLLLLETALTRWIAIQRKTGEEGTVTFEDAGQPSARFRDQLARMKEGTG
jgi:hypothetical protein